MAAGGVSRFLPRKKPPDRHPVGWSKVIGIPAITWTGSYIREPLSFDVSREFRHVIAVV